MKNLFDATEVANIIERMMQLTPDSKPQWGKMDVAQMIAHCNVAYETTFDESLPKPGALVKFFLRWMVKSTIVGDKPYKKNSQTAPQFLITDKRDLDKERQLMIGYLQKVQGLGESYFHNKESHSLGKLTSKEWNAMFYKHLNYHLEQFDV